MYEGAPELPRARTASGRSSRSTRSRSSTPRRPPSAPSSSGATQWPQQARPVAACACSARVGEPINPEAWMWYHAGHRRRPLPDRRHLVADRDRRDHDLAAARRHADQAGLGARCPFSGVVRRGRRQATATPCAPNEGGFLVIKQPGRRCCARSTATTSATRSSTGADVPGVYFTGDGARRDEDGYFWVMGRVDDVLNVAGHRLGTMEIESALVTTRASPRPPWSASPTSSRARRIVAFVTLEAGRRRRPTSSKKELARARRQGDRRARPARRDPLHRRAAQDPQRQDHAPPAQGHRRRRRGHGRHHARSKTWASSPASPPPAKTRSRAPSATSRRAGRSPRGLPLGCLRCPRVHRKGGRRRPWSPAAAC